MTRPRSNTVDYFPHDVHHGKTITILKGLYGIEGYAFWFQLLEILASTENHYIVIENQIDIDYLATRIGIQPDNLIGLLDKLAGLSAINAGLLLNHNIIWCQNLVDRVADVYTKNRGRKPPEKPNPTGKPSNPYWLSLDRPDNLIGLPSVYPQSKVKESKVKESKENPLIRTPENPEFGRLANLLFHRILNRHPNHKPPDFKQWYKHIRLMLETDKRDPEEIESVIEWCQQDYFWQNNILSTEKLRKQYDHLILKMNSNGKPDKKVEDETPEINAIYSICPDHIYRDERNNPRCRLEDTEPENCRLAGDGRCGKWKDELFEKV